MPRTPAKPKATAPDDSADQRAAEAAAEAPAEPEKEGEKPAAELTAEEYMQHRAEVLARLPAEEERPKNIYARLAQINGFVGLIRKTGFNDFHKYTFAKESDLVEEVRPMLAAYGIWIEQGLLADPELGFIAHQRLPQYKQRDNITIDSLTVITKRFRFVWWNPESKALEYTEWVPFMGYGDDPGDKGYYKAETGAVKYFLMKTFMIATGNDPEADAAVDRRAAERGAGPGGGQRQVQRAGGQRGPAQPGGRQQQASAPQSRQIGELLRASGIRTTVEAIKRLEALTGDTIEIKDPEEMAEALQAYITNLSGPKAGAVVQKLRAEAEKPPVETDAEKPPVETDGRPAAADFTEDEAEAPDPASKGWSGDEDGSIDSAIA